MQDDNLYADEDKSKYNIKKKVDNMNKTQLVNLLKSKVGGKITVEGKYCLGTFSPSITPCFYKIYGNLTQVRTIEKVTSTRLVTKIEKIEGDLEKIINDWFENFMSLITFKEGVSEEEQKSTLETLRKEFEDQRKNFRTSDHAGLIYSDFPKVSEMEIGEKYFTMNEHKYILD